MHAVREAAALVIVLPDGIDEEECTVVSIALRTRPSRRSLSCVSVFHRCSQEDSELSSLYWTFG